MLAQPIETCQSVISRRFGLATAAGRYANAMERRTATVDEARALAHPLRLRILRLCLNEALTNKQLAGRLGEHPATVLHHVRTLERTGFIAPEAERAGPRGSTEKPYRATGKSWTLDFDDAGFGRGAMLLAVVDAFRAEVREAPPDGVFESIRMGLLLRPGDREELTARVNALLEEYIARQDPAGEPIGLLFATHSRSVEGPAEPGPRGTRPVDDSQNDPS
jgi:DNA-binding transcriptional ArsR family regulator